MIIKKKHVMKSKCKLIIMGNKIILIDLTLMIMNKIILDCMHLYLT